MSAWQKSCLPNARQKAEKEEGTRDQEQPSVAHPTVIYFLRQGPTFYFSLSPNNAFIFGIYQRIHPLIRSESSGSNHFPKANLLATKSSDMNLCETFHIETITNDLSSSFFILHQNIFFLGLNNI
jgi:hypothetical protein